MSYHAESFVIEPMVQKVRKNLKACAIAMKILDGTRCKGLGRSCALGTIVTGSRENRDVKTVIEKYVRP